jgi:hypothetical protein
MQKDACVPAGELQGKFRFAIFQTWRSGFFERPTYHLGKLALRRLIRKKLIQLAQKRLLT